MEFRVAFINCRNLTAPRKRVPDFAAKRRKVLDRAARLAATLANLWPGSLPDLVGLCEIGTEDMGLELLAALDPLRYQHHWQKPPRRKPGSDEERPTGLMLAFAPSVFRAVEVARSEPTVLARSRYHWFAVALQIRRNGGTFWTILNHWPSDFGRGKVRSTWPRVQVGAAVGEFCSNRAQRVADAMLLLGDFNCEPYDPAVTGEGTSNRKRIVGVRERARAVNVKNWLPYFFNPMWSHLGESIPSAAANASTSAVPSRPPGTWAERSGTPNERWLMLDQLMVNKRLLTGGPATLVESSIRILRPRVGESDHCAIGAVFEYV